MNLFKQKEVKIIPDYGISFRNLAGNPETFLTAFHKVAI